MIQIMDEQARITELDLARISIVSASSRVAPKEKEWKADFSVDGVFYQVSGYAHRRRPYGLDGDILMNLQTLFMRAGCPPDNRVSVLPSSLLQMTGMGTGGKEYARLREGILRLWSVKWEMTARWSEGKELKQRTNASGLLSDVWLDERGGISDPTGVQISPDGKIEIVFTATFANLIRQGLYQILDGELLAQLGNPTARSLYRSLAAHRIQKGGIVTTLNVNLLQWGHAHGFQGNATHVWRSLQTIHEHLIEAGYLSHVTDEGRGEKRTLTYHFHRAAQPEQVQALTSKGVGAAVAASLSADHPERVYPALRTVEEKLGSGWKPRSVPAAIVDAVRNPSKWGYAAQEISPAPSPKKARKKAAAQEEAPLDPRDTVRSLLRVRLGRPASAAALRALDSATPEQLSLLKTALTQHPSNMALVESILGENC